jgi:hypothetical protein
MSLNLVSPRRQLFFRGLLAGFVFAGFADHGQASEITTAPPKVFSADPQTLVASKSALAVGDATLRPALKHLLAGADKLLAQKPASVMDKTQVPPSGDKHDFISQAPYFWRDTN